MLPAKISCLAFLAIVGALTLPAAAQENYESWEPLKNPFPSTGGGGIMIGEYRPVVMGDKCRTDCELQRELPEGFVQLRRIFVARRFRSRQLPVEFRRRHVERGFESVREPQLQPEGQLQRYGFADGI